MNSNITIPHNYIPRSYQLPLLKAIDNGIKRAIYVVHRRAGKDKTAWNITIKKALERVGTYYYFLPYYEQARKVIWDGIDSDGFRFVDHIPKSLIKSITDKPMQVQLVNGSIIEVVGADRIDSIVGSNPIGVVFSEFSIMKENVWQFISPILAANGGWAIFIFTPRGTNHAWKLIQKHKEDPDWFISILPVSETKAVDESILESEKKSLPKDIYEQEYEVKFIDGGSQVFKNVEKAVHTQKFNPDQTHKYQIGVDLAKSQDYTVITVFDLMTFKEVEKERFNHIDWNLQKAKIELYHHKYFKPVFIMDATGVGDPIVEDLQLAGLDVIPFKFTEQSRTDLLNNLSIKLQVPTINILNDPTTLDELKSFQYEISGSKVKMVASGHDDTVMSLALAVWDLPANPKSPIIKDNGIKYLVANFGDSGDTNVNSEYY